MSSSGEDHDRGQMSPQERALFEKRAAELGRRLDAVKGRKAESGGNRPAQGEGSEDDGRRGVAMGQALRIPVELAAGLAVGGGLGWFLDQQLATRPWLLVVGLVVGFCAGMLNVIRTARQMQASAEPMQRNAAPVADDADENDDK